jgi:hypothetical protein
MLALYLKCMMMNLTLPSLFTLSFIALLLLYTFIIVYIHWASRCMCLDGNSGSWRVWGKNRQEKAFLGTLAGVSSKQPLWDRGLGCTPQCIPACWGFTDVWRTWACPGLKLSGQTFSLDLFVHTTSLRVGLGPSWARQVRNHTYQQDRGYQWGRGGSETTFSQCVSREVGVRGGSFWGPDAGWDCNYREFTR